MELLHKGVVAVINNDLFHLQTTTATSTLKVASDFKMWMEESNNHAQVEVFAAEVTASLKRCLPSPQSSNQRIAREKLWTAYHQLRTSEKYIALWRQFLQGSVGVSSCAIFYQHVGDFMIKELIKENFKVCSSTHVDQEPVLNMYEANALRYAAGYIPRALRKKLQNSAEPLKDKLIICLLDLLDDGEDEHVESHEWILSIDRGGLCHVNNTCYLLFQAMELEIRRHIQNDLTPNFLHVQTSLMHNDDVLFYWSIIGCDWEEEESAALLPMVVNLWITIRGFSYCSAWVEKYKAEHKKSVQKSKGVRKQLISSSHTTKEQS